MFAQSKQKIFFSSSSESQKKKSFSRETQIKFASKSIYENNHNNNSSFGNYYNSSVLVSPQKHKFQEFIEDLNKFKFSIKDENSEVESEKVYNSNVIDIINSLNYFSNSKVMNTNCKNNEDDMHQNDNLPLENKKNIVSALKKDIENLEIDIWKNRASIKEILMKKKNMDYSSNDLKTKSELKVTFLNEVILKKKEKLEEYELEISEALKEIQNNKNDIKRLCDKKSLLLRANDKFMKEQEFVKNELKKKMNMGNKKMEESQSFIENKNDDRNREISKSQQILLAKQKDLENNKKETLELEGNLKLLKENSAKAQIKDLTEIENLKSQIENLKATNSLKNSNELKLLDEMQKNKKELLKKLNLYEQKEEEISQTIERRKIQIDSLRKKLNESRHTNTIAEKKQKSKSDKLINENDSKEEYIENFKLELDKIEIEFEDYSAKMEEYLNYGQENLEKLEEKNIMLLNLKKRKSVTIDVTQKNLLKRTELIEKNKEHTEEIKELYNKTNNAINFLNELSCQSKKNKNNEYETLFEKNSSLKIKLEQVSICLKELDNKKKEKTDFLSNLKEINENANRNGLIMIEKNKILEKRLESANKISKKKKGFFF